MNCYVTPIISVMSYECNNGKLTNIVSYNKL